MRIWSLHPQYLDTKGLVTLWRETLLAKNVLAGNTKGYKNHPKLLRFKNTKNPLVAINRYLAKFFHGTTRRDYNFNREKNDWDFIPTTLTVTKGQVHYERNHLLRKLQARGKKIEKMQKLKSLTVHPLFE